MAIKWGREWSGGDKAEGVEEVNWTVGGEQGRARIGMIGDGWVGDRK